uniref:Uncharacterized protein n=1 Tax=Steinernema glaseri TaxID=37863 RepID=A0A1I7ZNG9_9BILA
MRNLICNNISVADCAVRGHFRNIWPEKERASDFLTLDTRQSLRHFFSQLSPILKILGAYDAGGSTEQRATNCAQKQQTYAEHSTVLCSVQRFASSSAQAPTTNAFCSASDYTNQEPKRAVTS